MSIHGRTCWLMSGNRTELRTELCTQHTVPVHVSEYVLSRHCSLTVKMGHKSWVDMTDQLGQHLPGDSRIVISHVFRSMLNRLVTGRFDRMCLLWVVWDSDVGDFRVWLVCMANGEKLRCFAFQLKHQGVLKPLCRAAIINASCCKLLEQIEKLFGEDAKQAKEQYWHIGYTVWSTKIDQYGTIKSE